MPINGINQPKTPQPSEATNTPSSRENVVSGLSKIIRHPFSNGGKGLTGHTITAGAPPESAVVNKVATGVFATNPFNLDARVNQVVIEIFRGYATVVDRGRELPSL